MQSPSPQEERSLLGEASTRVTGCNGDDVSAGGGHTQQHDAEFCLREGQGFTEGAASDQDPEGRKTFFQEAKERVDSRDK